MLEIIIDHLLLKFHLPELIKLKFSETRTCAENDETVEHYCCVMLSHTFNDSEMLQSKESWGKRMN